MGEFNPQTLGPALTRQELHVLQLLVRGESNKRIALLLGVTVGTVHGLVGHILEELGAHNRTQAAAMAVAMGMRP